MRILLTALLLGVATLTDAASLASSTLLLPLAPQQSSRLSLPMPATFAPDQPVWVAYQLVALSEDQGREGEVGIEGLFEGVMTPARDMFVTFHGDDMDIGKSAGTIPEQLAKIVGPRSPQELRALMGTPLYAAYEAVNAGRGRILSGRIVRTLGAPGRGDTPLMVSVERAQGMQPVALQVTVGQGPLPPELQSKPEDSAAFRIGRIAGGMLFAYLLYRFFSRRRRET